METLLIKVSETQKANMLVELLKSMDFVESVDYMGDLKSAGELLVKDKSKLSDKYKGIISKEEGQKLNDHIKQMRSEWNGI